MPATSLHHHNQPRKRLPTTWGKQTQASWENHSPKSARTAACFPQRRESAENSPNPEFHPQDSPRLWKQEVLQRNRFERFPGVSPRSTAAVWTFLFFNLLIH
jgi:hypothetical protein